MEIMTIAEMHQDILRHINGDVIAVVVVDVINQGHCHHHHLVTDTNIDIPITEHQVHLLGIEFQQVDDAGEKQENLKVKMKTVMQIVVVKRVMMMLMSASGIKLVRLELLCNGIKNNQRILSLIHI